MTSNNVIGKMELNFASRNFGMNVLLSDTPAAGVARLRLNRPRVRNALSLELRIALADGIAAADGDESVRAIVIAGGDSHRGNG